MEADTGLLQEMTEAIVEAVHPDRIILFGSWARGQATAQSDVDLLIIEEGPFEEAQDRLSELTRLWRVLAPFRVPKDILLYTRSEFERWQHTSNHVIARAVREGRVLYERP